MTAPTVTSHAIALPEPYSDGTPQDVVDMLRDHADPKIDIRPLDLAALVAADLIVKQTAEIERLTEAGAEGTPAWLVNLVRAAAQAAEETACEPAEAGVHAEGCDRCAWEQLYERIPHTIRAGVERAAVQAASA